MRYLLALLSALIPVLSAHAQDGELLEYQQEIGGGVGLMSYIGDAGGGLLKSPGVMGTLIWRRNLNSRMVVHTDVGFGKIRGNSHGHFFPTDPHSHTPEGGQMAPDIRFNRSLVTVGAQFEFNFLGYGMGAGYKGLHRWTPYLLAGAGATMATGGGGSAAGALHIPLGFGFRYKLRQRLNIGLEWSFNFTTSDRLDDSADPVKLVDPYGIKSGMFKNKDCFTRTFLFLTYDISPKYRKCNN